MEREYVVSFIIVLAVIMIVGIIYLANSTTVFQDVTKIAKDVFKFGEDEKKVKQTQHAIQSLIETLEKCQKTTAVGCTCNIENKQPLPKDYRIYLKVAKDEKTNKPSLIVYAFSKDEAIVGIKQDAKALKLDGLKLGMGYWADCKDCDKSLIPRTTEDPSFVDKELLGDIYCIFDNKNLEGSKLPQIQDKSVLIRGDSDNDWSFPFYRTSGTFFDLISSTSKDKDLRSVGNILKLDQNTYCFLTTNLVPYRHSYFKKFFDPNYVGGNPEKLKLKKEDNAIKILDLQRKHESLISELINKMKKKDGSFFVDSNVGYVGSTTIGKVTGNVITGPNPSRFIINPIDIAHYTNPFFGLAVDLLIEAAEAGQRLSFHELAVKGAILDLKYNTPACDSNKEELEIWRNNLNQPGISVVTKEVVRPFDWPIKHKDMKVVCGKAETDDAVVTRIERIQAPVGTDVIAPTDAVVWEVCDEKCTVGKKYVILKNDIEKAKTYAVTKSGSSAVYTPISSGTTTQKLQQNTAIIEQNISRLIFLGNLQEVNTGFIKKGKAITSGSKIGTLGIPSGTVAWLDYRMSLADYGSSKENINFYTDITETLKQFNRKIPTKPDYAKDKFLYVRSMSPYARLHLGAKKLLPSRYVGCDDPKTPENELDGALKLEREFGDFYLLEYFAYGENTWSSEAIKHESKNPRTFPKAS